MPRLMIGSLVAAIAMFVLGFVFYGTPLFGLGWAEASPEAQASIQSALRVLPRTGTYVIPSGETPAAVAAYAAGPVAQIAYSERGFAMVDPMSLAGGYVHMAISVFMLGCVVLAVPATTFAVRARVVIGVAAVAVVYLHIAGPVWYHTDWRNALYKAVADFIILSAGGLILARWFVRKAG